MQSKLRGHIAAVAMIACRAALVAGSGCLGGSPPSGHTSSELDAVFESHPTEPQADARQPADLPPPLADQDVQTPPAEGPAPIVPADPIQAPPNPPVPPTLAPAQPAPIVQSAWSQQNDFLLSLDAEHLFAPDVQYTFDDDGRLISAGVTISAEELASMAHLVYAEGASDVTVEADLISAFVPSQTQVRLWEIRLSGSLWGELSLTTDLEFHESELVVAPDGEAFYQADVVRTDEITLAGSAYTSTYRYSGVQSGWLSDDGTRIVWAGRIGEVTATHDPPCEPDPCPEIIDLSQDSGLGVWDRVQ